MLGHFTNTSQHFWMMLQSSERKSQEQSLPNFNSYLNNYFKEKGQSIQTITDCRYLNKGRVIVSGILNCQKQSIAKQNWSFLIGSCAFPYPFAVWSGRKKEIIFEAMEAVEKDFMIWMGDNVYYMSGAWKNKDRMHRINHKMRLKPGLHKFLTSCPQYAIWDDHDYGPNNSDAANIYKYNSLDIFKSYWPNPSYGLDTVPGIFTCFSQQDADFFLLDSRFHSSDSSMLGKAQFEWLIKKLKTSTANFKFIVSGTQILINNPFGEDLGDFGNAKQKLLAAIKQQKISGVLFLSGDRHYGEILKLEQKNQYPLYEITSSPLTSILNPAYTQDSLVRVPNTLIMQQNFARLSISGKGFQRKCRVDFYNKNGAFILGQDIFLRALQAQ